VAYHPFVFGGTSMTLAAAVSWATMDRSQFTQSRC